MSGLDGLGRSDEDERDGSVVRDEGLSKNPIRNHMSVGIPSLRPDDLTEIVARARDQFHSFISQTVRRRYKRPPIYLVDRWVTDAFGFFTQADVNIRSAGGASPGPRPPGVPGKFEAVARLFDSLQRFLSTVDGLSVLQVRERQEHLSALSHALLGDLSGAREACRVVHGFRHDAFAVQSVIGRDPTLSPQLNGEFFAALDQRSDELIGAIERFARAERPVIAGISFEPGRHGGVLLESIPELDIEGPAIVISPSRISEWAASMPLEWTPRFSEASRTSLGARRPEHVGLAMAIGNVVQHEMTHAMLRLANDVPQEVDQSASQNALYRRRPEIEEGIANSVAALTMSMAVLKTAGNIIGPRLLDLTSKRHGRAFQDIAPLVRWSFANYHRAASEEYLHAFEDNARNFKAFGGLLAMFATDHASIDWDATYEALTHGVISTTKLRGGSRT